MLPTVTLSPTIRSSALPSVPTISISSRALAPLLNLPIVVDAPTLETAPRIVASQERPKERRAYLGKDDRISVAGELHGASTFRIVRSGRRLQDPVSKDYLGDEIVPVGTAILLAHTEDGLHRFLIVDATREITIGDRLLALPPEAPRTLLPYRPSVAVNALVVSIADTADRAEYAAQHQTVAINKGAHDNIREGALLDLSTAAGEFQKGRLLIVRVFDRISYGLITQATEPVQVGDKAHASACATADNTAGKMDVE